MNYIDVSEWQGDIDWETARTHVDGAILRAGYGKGNADKRFERNASECNRLGIPCGAYWFSYAKSEDEARAEAEHLLAAVAPYRMELPLCFDFEYDSVTNAHLQGVRVTKTLASAMARAFLSRIEEGGYWALNYANPDFLGRLYEPDIPQRWGLWLAQWTKGGEGVTAEKGADKSLPAPPRKCAIWQHASRGAVPGVKGYVDLDLGYTDFAKLIREKGLNRLGEGAGEGRPSQSASLTAPPEGEPRRCGAETAPSPAADETSTADPHLPPPLGEVPSEARRRGCVTDDEPDAVDEPPALAWAIAAGLLPPDADAAAALTLGAAAEMLRRYHGVFAPGENAEGTGAA